MTFTEKMKLLKKAKEISEKKFLEPIIDIVDVDENASLHSQTPNPSYEGFQDALNNANMYVKKINDILKKENCLEELYQKIEKVESHLIKYEEETPPKGYEEIWRLLLEGFTCYYEGLSEIIACVETNITAVDDALFTIYCGDVLIEKAESLIEENTSQNTLLAVA